MRRKKRNPPVRQANVLDDADDDPEGDHPPGSPEIGHELDRVRRPRCRVVHPPFARAVVDGDERGARPHQERQDPDQETADDREPERKREGEPRRGLRVDPAGEHPPQPRPLHGFLRQHLGRRLGRLLPDHGRGVARREEGHERAAGEGEEHEHEEGHRLRVCPSCPLGKQRRHGCGGLDRPAGRFIPPLPGALPAADVAARRAAPRARSRFSSRGPGGPAERARPADRRDAPRTRLPRSSPSPATPCSSALTSAAGLLLTELLVPVDGFEKWDNDLNRWLAERRSAVLTDLSWLGSTVAGGLVIPGGRRVCSSSSSSSSGSGCWRPSRCS